MPFCRAAFLSILLVLSVSSAFANFEDDYESKGWKELEVQLPDAPRPASLLPFQAGSASENQFFIDGATLSVGSDGVVRYVLLVLSPEGGRNVTFEGMRCLTGERRIYASGRSDGSWSRARKNEWVRIQDIPSRRHHQALFLEYFCPFGITVRDVAEARKALVQGVHPDNRH